ncbi:hypothetical protein [Nannocystis bainbridge]|uniref:Uncharacterized protein n=1 Tax=Nannocystis bainbridge TaxID=2995303 RepID=A0ABT5DSE7_9BACT|nr:hypothetical protein [Nannocystis bainbridge]MDC0716466.1 hypothetical protein [Nannocystis bainbridge]
MILAPRAERLARSQRPTTASDTCCHAPPFATRTRTRVAGAAAIVAFESLHFAVTPPSV